MARKSDKRERLVKSAKKLILKKGFNETTLADIAQDSGVPLGNVYYYFQTKDAILDEVINEHNKDLEASIASWNEKQQAREKLHALIKCGYQSMDDTVSFGCAIGSLCQELSKVNYELASKAAELLDKLISWAAEQVNELVKDEKRAKLLATNLVANLQGSFLLANTFKNKEMNQQQKAILCEFVDNL